MGNKKCSIQNNCPFWRPDFKKCHASNGGLFIPLDDHIDVYCKTSDYPQCLQYSMHVKAQLGVVEMVPNPGENRRKHKRHPSAHMVTLVKLIKSNKVVSHLSTAASTLDLSKGGMRLHLNQPLSDDTVIRFSFEDSLPETLREGTGQVQWCNKQIDDTGYQVGIAFQEEHLIKTMGLYLDLQNSSA